MKSCEQIADSILEKYNSRLEEKRRKTAVIRRSAALALGCAAVLGIGVFTHAMKPPKKPTPSQSGIIAETETTSAETTAPQTTAEVHTTAGTSRTTGSTVTATATTALTTEHQTSAASEGATASTARTTTTSARRTTASASATVTTARTTASTTRAASTATSSVTTRATVTVSTARVTSIIVETVPSYPEETTRATVITATSTPNTATPVVVTTTTTAVVTTTFAPHTMHPPDTTTTSVSDYNGNNYMDIRIGNASTVYTKTCADYQSTRSGKYIKRAFIYEVGTDNDVSATVYSVAGVSEKCVVAIDCPSAKTCPIYMNTEYEPATLRELVDDLALMKYMSFGSKNVRVPSEGAYYDVDEDTIIEVLDECRDAANTNGRLSDFSHDLIITVDIPYISRDTYIIISQEGYIMTNITDREATFYIGRAEAQSCMEKLLGK